MQIIPTRLLLVLFLTFYNAVSVHASEPALLTQVIDSLGNVQTNSWSDEENGGWPSDVDVPLSVAVGDTITFTASASDREGSVLEYRFSVQSSGGDLDGVRQDWSSDNAWEWSVTRAEFGPDTTIVIAVRDDDGLDFQGSESWDDYTYAIYDVEDPTAGPQATLIQIQDSLGNVNPNSWAVDKNGGWPNDVQRPIEIKVGDTLTFVASGFSQADRQLEYQFIVDSQIGSSQVAQPWGSSNEFEWLVGPDQYGQNITVLIAVRDDDGLNYFNSLTGDDYTYATYDVEDPSASAAARINRVTDSRGQTQLGSFGNGVEIRSQPRSVNSGSKITITVNATDPDGGPLEYKFAIQPTGFSFEVRQDWSANNTFDWEVSDQDYGARLTVLIAVKDSDGRDFFGPLSGDDYTYLQYEVGVDISGALMILLQ